jgi:ATP-binding cassette subfamily F protein uup
MAVNLVNVEQVSKVYGTRALLDGVSLGVSEGDRIGVVGRNGDGKTTLIRMLAKLEDADTGRVTHNGGLRLGVLTQHDSLDPKATIRHEVIGDLADHEWAADSRTREVVEVLLAGVALDREIGGLSGGERRRCSLARLLLGDHDLVVLDEPTNHLDVEAVAWLALVFHVQIALPLLTAQVSPKRTDHTWPVSAVPSPLTTGVLKLSNTTIAI